MVEFTGERVVPGQVDRDLWNEHLARYAFASRLARRKRVLDAGCGAGYGTAELSRVAASVIGMDVSGEAVGYCKEHYPIENVGFVQASCSQIPMAGGTFHLVVAFEVIEHLEDWRGFLEEARRVLAPGGQCVISTPNKDYYTDSRGEHGANPYHVHEFTFQEFQDALLAVFPHVSLFLQNRAEGFVFQPARIFTPAEARVESSAGQPEDSNFFVAVCAAAPQTGAPTFLFVPRAANILRERELHIGKLNHEIDLLVAERDKLAASFRQQGEELEEHNRWAERLDDELKAAGELVARLQAELAAQAEGYEAKISELQAELAGHVRGYEAKVAELEEESRRKTAWGMETERRLSAELAAKCEELGKAVDALHAVEKTLEERTLWARDLDRRVEQLEAELTRLHSSRWVKLGSALGVAPRRPNE